MPEERDPQLLRWFAERRVALDDGQFTERVLGRLGRARRTRLGPGTVRSITGAILSGFATAITAPLQLRRAGLLALVAAAVTLGTGLLSL
jgi:hypothetical protein